MIFKEIADSSLELGAHSKGLSAQEASDRSSRERLLRERQPFQDPRRAKIKVCES